MSLKPLGSVDGIIWELSDSNALWGEARKDIEKRLLEEYISGLLGHVAQKPLSCLVFILALKPF